MAAPSVASIGAIATGTGTTTSIPVPSGVVAGSKVVVFLAAYSSSTMGANTVTPPSGFTLGGFYNWHATNEGVYQADYWFWKDATASDTGSYAFSVPDYATGYAIRLTGSMPVGTSPFVDTIAGAGNDTASSTIASFTPGGDDSLLLLGAFGAPSSTFATPSGWTQIAQSVGADGSTHAGVFSLTQTTAEAVNPTLTATGSSFSSALVAILRAGTSASVGATVATVSAEVLASTIEAGSSPDATVSATVATATALASNVEVSAPSGWANAIARAQAGTGYARILFVGDSLTEGAGASSRAARFEEKLAADIRTRYSIAGSSYYVAAGQWTNYDDTWYDDLSTGTGSTGIPDAGDGSRATTDGLVADWTLGDHGSYLDSGEYRDLSISGNGFEVVYCNQGTTSGAGDIQVYVDSTLVDTIDANTSTAQSLRRSHYTCTSGSHTVRLQATGGTAVVDGLVVYSGDDPTANGSGLVFYDCAHTGWESDAFLPTSEVGKTFGDLVPDLIVYNMWTNDMFHSRTQASTLSNIDTALTYFESLDSQPDVLVWISNDDWSDQTTTLSWINAVADLVTNDHPNVQLVNMQESLGWMASGNIDGNGHPNSSGQAIEASAVDSYLASIMPVNAVVDATVATASAEGYAVTISAVSPPPPSDGKPTVMLNSQEKAGTWSIVLNGKAVPVASFSVMVDGAETPLT